MNLDHYFKTKDGTGVFASSSKQGAVDIAVYSKPHVLGRNKIAFVMRHNLSYRNLKSNPKAAYMFKIKGQGTSGMRLYLRMTKEETDSETVLSMRRRKKVLKKGEKLSLVHFRVNKARALVGDREYVLS